MSLKSPLLVVKIISFNMKILTVLPLLFTLSCQIRNNCFNVDRHYNEVLSKNQITEMRRFQVQPSNEKTLVERIINDSKGNHHIVSFYQPDGSIDIIEKYTYDNSNRVLSRSYSTDSSSWTIDFIIEYDDELNNYKKTVYKSEDIEIEVIYFVDQKGRDKFIEYFENHKLSYIDSIYYSNSCLPDSIVRFETNGITSGEKIIQKNENDQVISKEHYSNNEVFQLEKFRYDGHDLVFYELTDFQNNLIRKNRLEYDKHLVIKETYSIIDEKRIENFEWKYFN